MKLTGYTIREAISQTEFDRDALKAEFDDALFIFRDEWKRDPDDIMVEYDLAECQIAKLQTVQMRYNLAVEVAVGDEAITLAEAVKQIGGAGRVAAIWKNALERQTSPATTLGLYGRSNRMREKDTLVAQPTLSRDVYVEMSRDAARYAAMLRNAIAEGNATVVEMEVEETLFVD